MRSRGQGRVQARVEGIQQQSQIPLAKGCLQRVTRRTCSTVWKTSCRHRRKPGAPQLLCFFPRAAGRKQLPVALLQFEIHTGMLRLYAGRKLLRPRALVPPVRAYAPALRSVATASATGTWSQPDAIHADGSTTTVKDSGGAPEDENVLDEPKQADPTRRAAYLWYDTLFPIRFAIWDVRGVISRLQQYDLLEQVRQLVPEDPRYAVTVESVEARAKDGGAFVRLTYSVPEEVVDEWRTALYRDAEDEAARAAKSKEMEVRVTGLIEREAVSSSCSVIAASDSVFISFRCSAAPSSRAGSARGSASAGRVERSSCRACRGWRISTGSLRGRSRSR